MENLISQNLYNNNVQQPTNPNPNPNINPSNRPPNQFNPPRPARNN